MSGHSGFAPIGGNIPVVNPPRIGQVGGQENRVGPAPGEPAPEMHEADEQSRPNARTLAQKLDAMLLEAAKLSVKSVSVEKLKKEMGELRLGKDECTALKAAAAAAQKALDDVSAFTGREIAEAFIVDEKGVLDYGNNAAAKAVQAAIDAQARLSEMLHDIANRPSVTGKAFDKLCELAFQCDRRQSEISTLALQLSDAVSQGGDDPKIAARLDAKLSELLPSQVLKMHGNAEALERLKTSLQPLADLAESFKNRPNASLTSEEFNKFAVETQNVVNALRHAVKEGFPAPGPGNSRIIPDRDFLKGLTTLANVAQTQLSDTRRHIGMAILERFAANNIGVSGEIDVVTPENLMVLEDKLPSLVNAVRIRRALRKALVEYAKNPASQEKRHDIAVLLQQYTNLNINDIKREISRLKTQAAGVMSADDWKMLEGIFKARTQSMKSQVVHFMQMVKTINEDMAPEQFLSTSSARTLLRGKLAFPTLVEARVHGMADADVDPNLDDSRLVSSKTLGAGNVNTVKLVAYEGGEERVFKPEASGRQAMENLTLSKDYSDDQQVANLNLATQSTANVLGLTDVCPKCSVGVHNGEYGLFMEKVPGVEAYDFNNSAKIPAGSLSASQVRALPADQHAKVVGRLMRGINRLEWLDLITGQGDRHKHNYMIDVKSDLTVSVKGIDNDQCFPAYRTGLRTYVLKGVYAKYFLTQCAQTAGAYPQRYQQEVLDRLLKDPGVKRGKDGSIILDTTKFKAGELLYVATKAVGMHGVTLPDYIDEDLYAQLLALETGEKRDAYFADLERRLPPAAVESARNRLDEAIAHAKKLFADGKVVAKDDFEKRDVQKRIMQRDLNTRNPVKPVKGYSLPTTSLVVLRSCQQVKSFFLRDIYGVATKKNWFN